jgi:hypothetical protein
MLDLCKSHVDFQDRLRKRIKRLHCMAAKMKQIGQGFEPVSFYLLGLP